MEQHSFGHWLRLKRKALDLTREGLAERVGYSAATIRKIEAEERRPSAQMVERLADLFHLPLDERAAFLRFARGDWRVAPPEHLFQLTIAGLPSDFPPLNTLTHRHNLPAQMTSFIAREAEIALILEYLAKDDIRLVTLIGPPGIGKTRLSIEAARAALQDFPDGVFFVALAPLEDPNLIAAATAEALGYVGAKNISTMEQIKEGIADKNLLLVLDNCEHLIDAVASLTFDLLSACAHLKILATSRESLRISGEWLYAIPAFDLPTESSSMNVENAFEHPALRLFAERARAVRSDFSLNEDNIKTVTAICARLDGLPLVIELIAARMRLMSPQALLARLSGRFVLTADGMRAASERQKTLNNAINWSYQLLPPEEQKLFAYLSVFSGGFTLETAEAMFTQKVTEKPLPTLIALLLNKSLLELVSDFEESSEVRYTMLATIREFARARLREMGEETESRNLHLEHFLGLAEKADSELRGHNQLLWLSRLSAAHDNLRAALAWAIETKQTEIALQMARTLDWFWFVRSDHNEGRHWLQRVLALPDTVLYPELHSEILTQLAHHTWLQVGAEQARPFAESALSLARAHSDKHNTAKALAILGLVMVFENSFVVASSYLEESKVLFQEVNDQWGFAHAVMCLGTQSHIQQDWAASLILYKQVLQRFRDMGDRFFQGVALRFIGDLEMKLGNLESGVVALRKSLILSQQLDSKFEIGQTLWRCAEAVQRLEKPAHAVCLYSATNKVLDSIGAWTEGDKSVIENDLAACRAALTEAEFEAALEQGRGMTTEQAIAYAFESSGGQIS